MLFEPEEVTVVIGGARYRQWSSCTIGWSYESTEITFGLEASEPDWSPSDIIPFVDERFEVYYGGTLMVRGYIDGYEADAEVEGASARHDVRITGRSKGKDAAGASAVHKTGRVEKKNLKDAANEYARSTGIDVSFTADVAMETIPKIQLQRGDTVFAVIEREARKQGLNLVGQPDGSIKITKPQGKRHAGQIIQGQNLKKASVSLNRSEQKSPIIAKGQKVLGHGKQALRLTEKEFDPTFGRFVPLVLYHEGDATQAALKKRIDWHKRRQSGKGKKFVATMVGWRDDAGQIWTPGHLVAIHAPLWHIEGDMLLQSVSFQQSLRTGTIATLTFVDPAAHGGKKGKGKTPKSLKAAS